MTRPAASQLAVCTSEAAVDHALALLLGNEAEAALRWSAAALEACPWMADSHWVTARALAQIRQSRAAADGLLLAITRATHSGNLPIALAAVDELRLLGCDVGGLLDRLARAFCRDSKWRGGRAERAPAAAGTDFVQPLSPSLSGTALADAAARIIRCAERRLDATAGAAPPPIAPLTLFGSLSKPSLRALLDAFQVMTVPAGHRLFVEEGEATAVYDIARGEVEVSPHAAPANGSGGQDPVRLPSGSFLGEMGLLTRRSNLARVTTTRPSILLVADRDVLLAFARRRPELGVQLAAQCRRSAFADLARTSTVVATLPPGERAVLADRFEMRFFERGERLARAGMEGDGLYFIVSGEVAIVARDYDAYVPLPTLGPGDTFGEVELVLWQRSYTDALATRPTATLFLSREEYGAMAQRHPNLLLGLYGIAMRRRAEERLALQAPAIPALLPPHMPDVDRTEMYGRRDARMLALPPADLAPAAPSFRPVSAPPLASGSPGWITFAGAALGAATASIVLFVALSNRHVASVRDTAVATPTAPALAVPSETVVENSITTSARALSAGANHPRPKARPITEKTRAASPSPSLSSSAGAGAIAAEPRAVEAGAHPRSMPARAVSSASDFGGRE